MIKGKWNKMDRAKDMVVINQGRQKTCGKND